MCVFDVFNCKYCVFRLYILHVVQPADITGLKVVVFKSAAQFLPVNSGRCFLTGPLACCSVLRVNAPVQPRRPSTLTLVLIRRWTHLISPLIPPLFQRPHVPIQILIRKWTKLTSLPHDFNYNISKTSLLYRLSLIYF